MFNENHKGQVGPIGAIILFGMFLVMVFIWLGGFMNDVGHQAVVDNNLTGLEAFSFQNFAFFVIIIMVLAMIGWMYFSNG